MTDDMMVRIDNVSVHYGTQRVLEGVSFDVTRGSVYALLGRNGAGKSSLIRCLLGLQKPTLGLDVVARNDFFSDFIGELADRGTTVILTTHDLMGVEGIADRVGILQGSHLAVDEDLERLKLDRGQSLEQIFMDTTRRSGRTS